MKKHDAVLWIGFAVYIFLQCTMKTSQWNILTVFTTAMGVVLLIKTGRPSGKHMVISAVLAVLAAAAYLGYKRDPAVLIYGLISAGIPTLISMSAVFSVMEKYGGYQFINRKGKHPVLISLAIAVIIGAGLSVINQMLPGEKGEAGFSLWKLLLALNPGIFEEAACRAVFMAYCIRFSEGRKMGDRECIYNVLHDVYSACSGSWIWPPGDGDDRSDVWPAIYYYAEKTRYSEFYGESLVG